MSVAELKGHWPTLADVPTSDRHRRRRHWATIHRATIHRASDSRRFLFLDDNLQKDDYWSCFNAALKTSMLYYCKTEIFIYEAFWRLCLVECWSWRECGLQEWIWLSRFKLVKTEELVSLAAWPHKTKINVHHQRLKKKRVYLLLNLCHSFLPCICSLKLWMKIIIIMSFCTGISVIICCRVLLIDISAEIMITMPSRKVLLQY